MKFWLLTPLFILTYILVDGQNPLVDSLRSKLKEHKREDSVRVSILTQLANEELYDHPSLAGDYAFEALSISKKINNLRGIALSYRLLGNSFWSRANQSAALDNFLKGLKIADSIHTPQIQADLLGNLGMVYNDINDFEKALQYYRRSLGKQIELKNRLREGVLTLNVGNAFYHLKKYDSSLIYYNRAIDILSKLKNTRTIIDLATIGIGEVYSEIPNYDEALKYLYRAKKSTDTTRHHRGMIHGRMTIANVMIKKHDYRLAQTELAECIALAKEVNLKTYLRDGYELLSKVSEAQGQTIQAFNYYKLFIVYKDSINSSAITSKVASLQLEYEMQRKQLEIDGLVKDSRLKAEELKFKNTLLASAVVGIALITLFLYFSVRNYRYQKALNRQLEERNIEINRQRAEIAQQHDEVSTLNEEILAQKEELASQNDTLAEKNKSIEQLNRVITEANENLEIKIALRTATLIEQNKRLEEYAYLNAHKLRSPVASIGGIINLLQREVSPEDLKVLITYLKRSSDELDKVIRSISEAIHQGIAAYDDQKMEHEPTKEEEK